MPPRNFLHGACEPTNVDEESILLEIPYVLDAVLTISNRKELATCAPSMWQGDDQRL